MYHRFVCEDCFLKFGLWHNNKSFIIERMLNLLSFIASSTLELQSAGSSI